MVATLFLQALLLLVAVRAQATQTRRKLVALVVVVVLEPQVLLVIPQLQRPLRETMVPMVRQSMAQVVVVVELELLVLGETVELDLLLR
jgi:hypothetical protein